jgi:hypothetical protein
MKALMLMLMMLQTSISRLQTLRPTRLLRIAQEERAALQQLFATERS